MTAAGQGRIGTSVDVRSRPASALDVLGNADYVLLTTFRKDGTPVPTPVWVVRIGDELRVWTIRDSGKVKRIRRSGRAQIAPCTIRGKPRGLSIDATARMLPDSEAPRRAGCAGRQVRVPRVVDQDDATVHRRTGQSSESPSPSSTGDRRRGGSRNSLLGSRCLAI